MNLLDEFHHQLWGDLDLNKVRELLEPQIFDAIDMTLNIELLQSIREPFD